MSIIISFRSLTSNTLYNQLLQMTATYGSLDDFDEDSIENLN